MTEQGHSVAREERHSPPVPTPMTERDAATPGEYPMADPSGDSPVEEPVAPTPEAVLGRQDPEPMDRRHDAGQHGHEDAGEA